MSGTDNTHNYAGGIIHYVIRYVSVLHLFSYVYFGIYI